MLQYAMPAHQCLVKMEECVTIPPGDTGACARMIIMEGTVRVSIILLHFHVYTYIKTILAQSNNYKSSDYINGPK